MSTLEEFRKKQQNHLLVRVLLSPVGLDNVHSLIEQIEGIDEYYLCAREILVEARRGPAERLQKIMESSRWSLRMRVTSSDVFVIHDAFMLDRLVSDLDQYAVLAEKIRSGS